VQELSELYGTTATSPTYGELPAYPPPVTERMVKARESKSSSEEISAGTQGHRLEDGRAVREDD